MSFKINFDRQLLLLAVTGLLFAVSTDFASAKKPDCNVDPTHPKCGDDGGGDPPGSGSANPELVYRDGGIFLANADGTSQTQIRSGGDNARLDAPGQRVLFRHNESLGNNPYLGLIPYSFVDGNILVGQEQMLVTNDETGAAFTSFGLTDWSQGGDKYSYSTRQNSADGTIYRIMISPGGTSSTFAQHTIAWEGAPDGGLGGAAWDASGDYIYLLEEFNLGVPQILLVIDITTNPGTVVASVDLTPLIAGTGFAADSNPQGISASYQTGGLTSSYSFDPNTLPARSDTSLCLMIPFADWSTRQNTRFTMIFDLPALFDADSGLSCPIATTLGSTILNFEGKDFTTGDAGIVGQDFGKNRVRGVWVYDLGSGSLTKIIGSGGFPDWSN